MGRIKSKAIKRTAKELFEREEAFSSSFENNKKVLQSYTLPDKGTRNKIAGYLARLKKSKIKSK